MALPSFSSRSLALLTAVVAVLAMLMKPVSAEICGPFPCQPAFVAPAAGASIPANVPAFPLIPEAVYSLGTDGGLHSGPLDAAPSSPTPVIELLDPLGEVVPVDIVLRVVPGSGSYSIIPRTTLVPGAYRFRQPITCLGSATSAPIVLPATTFGEQPFNVIAAAPLPTTVGSVTVSPPAMTTYRVGAVLPDGGCSEEKVAAVATLAFTPSPELVPFLPVARFEVCLDGVWCLYANWGNVDSAPHPASQPFYDKFFTLCPPEELGPGLGAGAHTGLFTARLPGQDPLPSVPFSFTLSCTNGAVEPEARDASSSNAIDVAPPASGLDDAATNRDARAGADVPAIGDASGVVPFVPDAAALAGNVDAAVDTPQTPSPRNNGSGCQCALTRRNGGMTGVLGLLGLVVVALSRLATSARRRSGRT